MRAMYWYCKVNGTGTCDVRRFPTKKAALAFAQEYGATTGYYSVVGNDDPRKIRDQAMRDCGLTKVRGALGGVYYE